MRLREYESCRRTRGSYHVPRSVQKSMDDMLAFSF